MANTQSFVCREKPNKLNLRTYVLANSPSPNTEQVFLNGVLQNVGVDNDYTISDKTILFNSSTEIEDTDVILVNYIIDTYTPPPADIVPSGAALEGRKNLIHWCLRRLGAPVIDINVDEDQIEDRVDEALMYFRDYHFDGVERAYLHYQITASSIELDAAYTPTIERGTILTGLTSGATASVFDKSVDGKIIRIKHLTDKRLRKSESVKIGDTDTVQILNSDTAVVIGDCDNKYINVGRKALAITNIIPQETATIGGNLGGMFDFQYQFALNNMFNLASTDLVTYDIYKQYTSLWEFMFRGAKGIRFNRKTDRVYLDVQDWVVGKWIILEAWVALDHNIYLEIYSDEFVREYAYNLIKLQWGTNLKKFSGVALPGGVTLNGQQIYDEAKADLETLRERVRKEFELPPDFFVG